MPSNGFSPRASARRRFPRSSSLTLRGLYPLSFSSPTVAALLILVVSSWLGSPTPDTLHRTPAPLTARVARSSTRPELGHVLAGFKERRRLPSGHPGGEGGELFHLIPLE